MIQTKEATGIINDLVKINNDRIEGYNRAAKETKDEDSDLKTLFTAMASQSFMYKQELSALVAQGGEEPEEGTRIDGKIYRAWMDVKASFSGNSRKSILENCEFGEDAAQKAYKSALDSGSELTGDVRSILQNQQQALKSSHDKIKMMRDQA